ncbi:hypothetical protein A9P82_05600 [Arachidicoccus ginsenosidimutans]|uniref:sigma-70 family RNA polymerase sigma factor n=1 Tax=Arachidicoccus sp. BS20 TaxID=1850526 RepID=UPI0007F17EB1|nr:sigma-70 family RNA polymerase sigma factor [Arachidicoccus sp. BS20]ANI88808.1 hypothetical protein A9P82_05600 [Arachidicoccus sp. BS20]
MSYSNALRNGNEEIFNQVYNEYHKKLYNYIIARTNSAYCAEEVVQLTFIKLWNSRKHLSDDVGLNIQIFRIAKTTLIDFIRKTQRNEDASLVVKNRNVEVINEVYKNVFYRETTLKLEKAVASLPPMRRKVFELSRYNEMSNKEISEKLSIAPKTVENHINLALRYIRAFLGMCLLFVGLFDIS